MLRRREQPTLEGREEGTSRAMEMEMRGFADAAADGRRRRARARACVSVMPTCVREPSYAHRGRTFTSVAD